LQKVQKATLDGSMDDVLTYLQATLDVLCRHLARAHSMLDEQQQQQQQRRQQEERDLAANSTPAPAGVAAAAAAAANAPELAPTCGLVTCAVATEQAVLLVMEVLQLLAAMSEQPDQQLRFRSLDASGFGTCLLNRQLMALRG
jgi:hypothetical protein